MKASKSLCFDWKQVDLRTVLGTFSDNISIVALHSNFNNIKSFFGGPPQKLLSILQGNGMIDKLAFAVRVTSSMYTRMRLVIMGDSS